MGAIFGGAQTGSGTTSSPVYTGIQIQTSSQSLPIPILWGSNRLAPNLINYINFRSEPASKGKGGKGNDDIYFADVQLALCEGASAGYTATIGQCWQGQSNIEFSQTGFGLYTGTTGQGVWPNAAAAGQDIAYKYTVVLAQGNLPLGSSASVPSYNFEVLNTFQNYHVGAGHYDANLGDIIPDFLTNPRYGVGLNADLLVGFSELTTYHLAQGIFVSPLLKDPEQVQSILQRWATIGNFWIFWSGTALKVVPLGDTTLTANGVTYTPNTTPIYDLGPDDFVVGEKNSNKNDPPLTVMRKDPADCYNIVQLDAAIRANHYETTPFRWEDQSSIDAVGVQSPNIISASEVCYGPVAAVIVSLVGLRQLYIRNTYKFKTLYNFILLEPGDLVTLTDPNIGLNQVPVRILTVEEDDKMILEFTAEEFPGNIGTASIQEFEAWAGTAPYDTSVAGGSINSPAFVQANHSLTQGQDQYWIALSGGPNYGGCGVFISFDGINYNQIGENGTPSIQGTLTAVLASSSGTDTTHTLAVDCTLSEGVIPSTATDADAQAGRTLVLVDDELLAYGSVDPTGEYTSNLTYLIRGLYGTTPVAHEIGAPFAVIDSRYVFTYPVQAQYLGTLIYFKFPTVNIFGNQAQSLAECTAYQFQSLSPNQPVITEVMPDITGPNPDYVTVAWTAPANGPPTSYNIISYGTSGSTTPPAPGTLTVSGTLTSVEIPLTVLSIGSTGGTITGSGDGGYYRYFQMQSNYSGTLSPLTPAFPTSNYGGF